MAETEVRRRRSAAILAADAAGYSHLMVGDDRATVAALDAARAVFRKQIESNQGRVVDMAGNSVLAVFEAAAGAMELPLLNRRSITVLPFINLSGDAEQEYFADGVTEEITTELSRFSFAVRDRQEHLVYLQVEGCRCPGRRQGIARSRGAPRRAIRAAGRPAVSPAPANSAGSCPMTARQPCRSTCNQSRALPLRPGRARRRLPA